MPAALRPASKPIDQSPVRWADCEDIQVREDDGTLLYSGPKWLRCKRDECRSLVTHGMVQQGGCWCGNRRVGPAFRLTTEEKALLKRGYYPMARWELELVQPTLPTNQAVGWGQEEWRRRHE